MFKLDSEEALRAAFRPKDRDKVELPPKATFPLVVRGYVAWPQASGGRAFLLFAVPGGAPTGIVFDTNGGGVGAPQMCDWCHSGGAQVGLLTAQRDANRRVGVHVCSDLGCKARLADEADRAGRTAQPQIAAVIDRMGRFASEALRMDLTGKAR